MSREGSTHPSLHAHEPLEVQGFRKVADHYRGICGIHLKLIQKIRKITTGKWQGRSQGGLNPPVSEGKFSSHSFDLVAKALDVNDIINFYYGDVSSTSLNLSINNQIRSCIEI